MKDTLILFAQSFKLSANDVGLQGTQVASADAAWTSIMNTVYSVAGIVAVIGIIIGAYLYVTSNGDASKVQQAKNAILYSVIGIVLVILAFAITQLVIATTQGGN